MHWRRGACIGHVQVACFQPLQKKQTHTHKYIYPTDMIAQPLEFRASPIWTPYYPNCAPRQRTSCQIIDHQTQWLGHPTLCIMHHASCRAVCRAELLQQPVAGRSDYGSSTVRASYGVRSPIIMSYLMRVASFGGVSCCVIVL